MYIDEIRVLVAERGYHANSRIRAFITLAISGGGLTLIVRDICVTTTFKDPGRLLVSWPARFVKGTPRNPSHRPRFSDDGDAGYLLDTTHPADSVTREYFDAAILTAYRRALASGQQKYVDTPSSVTQGAALRVVGA